MFVAVIGLVAPAILWGGKMRNTRTLHQASDLADLPFDSAAPRTLLMVSSDNMASATTYLQGVENRRPDVTTVVKQHVSDVDYIHGLYKHHGNEHFTDKFMAELATGTTTEKLVTLLIAQNKNRRPVLWELGDPLLDDLVVADLVVLPSLCRLFGKPVKHPHGAMFSFRHRWRLLSNGRWAGSSLEEISHMYTIMGAHLVRTGRTEDGFDTIAEAYATWQQNPQVMNNHAIFLQHKGRHLDASRAWKKVVLLRPAYALAWYNLGTSHYNLGNLNAASEAFATALTLTGPDKRTPKMAFYLSILHHRNDEHARAHALLTASIDHLPGNMRPQANALLKEVQSALLESTRTQ
jgi:hypothetical protein